MFAEGRENQVAEKEEEELVERKNLVEITFPERRLGSTISECFLGNSRLASWIRHGPRSFVHIVAPPFVRPLGVGGFARAPRDSRSPCFVSFRFIQAPPLHPPPPLFRFPDFHNFFAIQPHRFTFLLILLPFLFLFLSISPSINAFIHCNLTWMG